MEYTKGDIYTDGYGGAVQVARSVIVDFEWHVIYRYGIVRKGEFVANPGSVVISKTLDGYTKYTAPRFKEGDLLASKDGRLFVYESEDKVWGLNKGTDRGRMLWSSLRTREEQEGTLELAKRGYGGPNFGTVTINDN